MQSENISNEKEAIVKLLTMNLQSLSFLEYLNPEYKKRWARNRKECIEVARNFLMSPQVDIFANLPKEVYLNIAKDLLDCEQDE